MKKSALVTQESSKAAEPLTFRRRGNGLFKLSAGVVGAMNRYVQNKQRAMEAGGVILGRHILGGEDIVADLVTVPDSEDRRSRYGFIRAREEHQAVIDSVWQESKRTCTYLGEWHTHPEHAPSPSEVDRCDWQRKLKEDQFYGDALFFVIVGIRETAVWEGFERDGSCEPLQLKAETDGVHSQTD